MKRLLPLLFLFPAFAAGSILFTVTSPTLQETPPGGISNPLCANGDVACLIFSGTITPDSVDTFINGIQISFVPATGDLVSNDNFFIASVPGLVFSTDSVFSGNIFEIDISLVAALGTYNGTATLLGGPNGPGDLFSLASDSFTVVVIPEPAAISLTLLGLALFALARVRTRLQE